MIYYGVFYKDKDGFELLCQQGTQMLVFCGQHEAKAGLKNYKFELHNKLFPIVEYKVKRRNWLGKAVEFEPIKPIQMHTWEREALFQKHNTCFLKAINVV